MAYGAFIVMLVIEEFLLPKQSALLRERVQNDLGWHIGQFSGFHLVQSATIYSALSSQ